MVSLLTSPPALSSHPPWFLYRVVRVKSFSYDQRIFSRQWTWREPAVASITRDTRDTRESHLPIKSSLCLQSSLWIICLFACLFLQFPHLWDTESTLPWLSCLRTGTQVLGKASIKFEPSCKYSPPLQRSVCLSSRFPNSGRDRLLALSTSSSTHKDLFFNAECINRNVS